MSDRVTKVKAVDGKITVDFTRPNGQDVEEIHFVSQDDPEPSFQASLDALVPHALEALEVEDSWKGKAKVVGATIGEGKGGRRTLTMAVNVALEHGAATVNTPLKTERESPDEVGAGLIPSKLLQAVLNLQAEAMAYVKGQREQTELALDGDDDEGDEEENGEVESPEALAEA